MFIFLLACGSNEINYEEPTEQFLILGTYYVFIENISLHCTEVSYLEQWQSWKLWKNENVSISTNDGYGIWKHDNINKFIRRWTKKVDNCFITLDGILNIYNSDSNNPNIENDIRGNIYLNIQHSTCALQCLEQNYNIYGDL